MPEIYCWRVYEEEDRTNDPRYLYKKKVKVTELKNGTASPSCPTYLVLSQDKIRTFAPHERHLLSVASGQFHLAV